MHQYIKIDRIYRKLKQAEVDSSPIYISAPTGYGKTMAVEYFYRNKAMLHMTGESGSVYPQPEINQITQPVIFIDDISWIKEQQSVDYINHLIEDGTHHIILCGRAKLPEWLKRNCIQKQFVIAGVKDLELNAILTQKLLEALGVKVDAQAVSEICKFTYGHALSTVMVGYQMKDGKQYTDVVKTLARRDMFYYFDTALYEKWSQALCSMLEAVAIFDSFNEELAAIVSTYGNIKELIEEAIHIGDFIICHEDGSYELLPMLRKYLQWKITQKKDENYGKDIAARAGLYYEMNGDVMKALHYYDIAGKERDISRLLIKNAQNHPGTAHFIETKEYYLALPEEIIIQSPILMAGMSMIYSLLIQPEHSEMWYQKLKEYEAGLPSNDEDRKDAKRRLIYLDIALPHRGSVKLISILKNAMILCKSKQINMPEFSVTSNLPSIMNGGKDFCEWSKSDRTLAIIMKKPIEFLLGKYSPGLVNISLAESFFEKGSKDFYEIISLLNSGYVAAEARGKIEMCFVSTAVLARVHVTRNQIGLAEKLLSEFNIKAKEDNATNILPNLAAMQVWLQLLSGNSEQLDGWMKNHAPNELHEFHIMERYRYMIKVRCYIALGRLEEAANLIERLESYYTRYFRTYMWIENKVLKSIVQFRMKLGDWRETLEQAINKAQEYHFIFVIAKEGAAVLPLLSQIKETSEYYYELRTVTQEMSHNYPKYLAMNSAKNILTEMERVILGLYAEGKDSEQICSQCCISYNTLKYHNRNIYRKLEVKNRTEALLAAVNRNLI